MNFARRICVYVGPVVVFFCVFLFCGAFLNQQGPAPSIRWKSLKDESSPENSLPSQFPYGFSSHNPSLISKWECKPATRRGTRYPLTCKFENVCIRPLQRTILLHSDAEALIPVRARKGIHLETEEEGAALEFKDLRNATTDRSPMWRHGPLVWAGGMVSHAGHAIVDNLMPLSRLYHFWGLENRTDVQLLLPDLEMGNFGSFYYAVSVLTPMTLRAFELAHGKEVCVERLYTGTPGYTLWPSGDSESPFDGEDVRSFGERTLTEMRQFRALLMRNLNVAERPLPRTGGLRVLILVKDLLKSSYPHVIGKVDETKAKIEEAFEGAQVTVTPLSTLSIHDQVHLVTQTDVFIARSGAETCTGLWVHEQAQLYSLPRSKNCKDQGECLQDFHRYYKWRGDAADCIGNGPSEEKRFPLRCFNHYESTAASKESSIMDLDAEKLIALIKKAVERMQKQHFIVN
mmetsp:Transcript_49724/g.97987  ORF Transcript_49724/g.97987 Transcript_49724/m.97987 type:complete len:459 (-) Transcript_49724:102-1478(-)